MIDYSKLSHGEKRKLTSNFFMLHEKDITELSKMYTGKQISKWIFDHHGLIISEASINKFLLQKKVKHPKAKLKSKKGCDLCLHWEKCQGIDCKYTPEEFEEYNRIKDICPDATLHGIKIGESENESR